MRTFLALELPDNFKQELSDIISHFNALVPRGIKWVEEENLHITFQFIGDTKSEDITEISEFVAEQLSQLQTIIFTNPKLEVIPGRFPRLIWVSLDAEDKAIYQISRKVQQKLQQMGYSIDRKPLKIHVTLGRVKKRLPELLISQILTTELKKREVEVSRATFYQSILRPQGPEYVALGHFELR